MSKELVAEATLSHYRIVSKIGAGGMGEVYLAEDTRLHRKVALKILPADLSSDKDRMRRFEQEAIAAAALNHPNIAHIYEIGQDDGTHFIAMEFIDGQTLNELIHHSQTDLAKLLRHLQHVAEGLAKAHAAGIVHRDLKPDNIMVSRDGHAKILDFGLAKLLEQTPASGSDSSGIATAVIPQHSSPGTVMGTVGYMSPEQAQGKTREIDQRSDIFSFGCILYEAVTRHKAFEGKDAIDSLNKIIREPAAPITDFRPDAPNHLQRIVRRCLAKDPEDRFQTIKDVAIELREIRNELTGSPGIDPTVPPASVDTVSSASSPARASSAEYIASGLKQHKRAAIVGLIALVAGVAIIGLYFATRNSDAAIKSVAVMPFVNENGNPDVEYLSDGMTETLIKSLSNLPTLSVKPRSSVFRYKGKDTDLQTIARELNVQAILNGRVGQRGDQLTLSLELVDVRQDRVIWSEQYQRRQSDLVSLQSEIARDVSTNLKAKLTGAEETKLTKTGTDTTEAYQAYLKGRYYWNRRTAVNLKKALEEFKTATDRDPNYALAFVGLADCYTVLGEYAGVPTNESLPKAKAYAERALAIDSQLAEPHATLGAIADYSWQWVESENQFKSAINANPNYATAYHWYSILLRNLGRNDESAAMIKRAQELDPLSSVIAVNISRVYQVQNNHDASIENNLKLIELDPGFGPAYEYLALSYLKQGRNAEAIAAATKSVDLSNRSGIALGDLGHVYARAGRSSEALAVIKELEDKYSKNEASGQHIAAVYAGLGDKDKAFEWLEKDFQSRNGRLMEIRWELQYEPLREDPRFKDILRRIGLPN